ncbi:S-adenosyl-L-methionine-dependent tRNA 4-demethylwyosine synthase TYW1 isoform X1 [Varanus komodoensis]|uniref:S-adenosyl-L-methionine-dependent tRNA 4-demethylwyosine synthase TYW1 isoform X1 n=1 Tax=Varanus komodoensis TaxID=61221 RepID=UPI001CF7DABE|nr:S-adenosyl-L-methionine-dependent tRNA 4-demethylwyosine synthase TYW1 isoform X1 [Varanus komodoensis]
MDVPVETCGSLYGHLAFLWLNRFYLYSCAALGFGLWICIQLRSKARRQDGALLGECGSPKGPAEEIREAARHTDGAPVTGVKVFFGSQTGTAKRFALNLAEAVTAMNLPAEVIDMGGYDPEDCLVDEARSKSVCVFLVATYTEGKPTENAAWFCKWLEEAACDFRVGQTYLKGLRYAAFGLGNSSYADHYNTAPLPLQVGRNVDKWLWQLGARRVLSCGQGDANVAASRHGSLEADFEAWKHRLLTRLRALCKAGKAACGGGCKKGRCAPKDEKRRRTAERELGTQEQEEEPCETTSEEDSGDEAGRRARQVVDVEDLGHMVGHMRRAQRERELDREAAGVAGSQQSAGEGEKREMLTPALREALTKQGYRLIGSHSGVKLCRWTKSMLRGRGGCYKHTFYGIQSHRCMETTPSLACANKCVFCWRHHTNPVGTEWRWKMDQPEMILQEALENHQNLIRQFRGVPGVRTDRLAEGLEASHCALSLVGEPIMYPQINQFLRLLHQRKISSFLVTNAQFPEEIRSLVPVTQLYVSVDASTPDSLRRIDRPLFKDFWARFLGSLQALAEKRQRTVYRLTLVKAWNVDELRAYAALVSLGRPDFIEVKGVTYCGESSASSLTMANVPWHEEVCRFVQELADLLPEYEIACEHKHSNCLLIAHKKFKIGGKWHTWIDYERFQDLVYRYEQSGGAETFTSEDYLAPTPPWAVFGAQEKGFDPTDTRFRRKNKTKDISGC